MTVLANVASVRFGNLRYDTHAVDLRVELGLLPAVDHVRCTLPGPTPVDAAPGDPAEVTLDGGDGSALVLTGEVRTIGRTFDGTVVTAVDGGAVLAAQRPLATYEAQAVGDVVRALAGDADVGVGTIDASTRVAFYVVHQAATAAEHVARLAALGGATARFGADGNLEVTGSPNAPDAALRFGRELVTYEVDGTAAVRGAPILVGHGAAGSVDAPDALVPTTEALTGGADDPGVDTRWIPSPVLRTAEGVHDATDAASTTVAAFASRLRASGWLLPSLRPGQLIEVQELPGELSAGPWLVTAVTHRLSPRTGGTTSFEAVVGGDALQGFLGGLLGGVGGLLGSAAGAIGGLL